MQSYRYVILGAGPSGLSFAHTLLRHGETSFVVLEKEATPGGLCRSCVVDGAPLDIGGGHFLDTKRCDVLDFVYSFMPKTEWCEYERISRIIINGHSVDYPLEANIWQFPHEIQLDYLESISKAGSVCGQQMPLGFRDWVYWKLGSRIAEDYMLPYNQKLWSIDLSKLGTYWLYKLPEVSFRDTLRSCLEKKSTGKIPAHSRFLYPSSFGYGEIWSRMGKALGNHLLTSSPITSIDVNNLIINDHFKADMIINTVPWTSICKISDLPSTIVSAIRELEYTSITIDYYPDNLNTDAHWIYNPDMSKSFHRILCRNNFLHGSMGHWTETNSARSIQSVNWQYINEYAYPVNLINKPRVINEILSWGRSVNIVGLGRWGTWEHMNSDVAVANAIEVARSLVAGM
ncbi:MAG: NAD(P)-binding protein [Geobacter sp.]|nr:NAD(P)-binding protein [Geobacter sp.]